MIKAPGRLIYTAPYDDASAPVLQLVGAARKSVHVIAYSLGLEPLVALLIAKHAAGLDVHLVLDLSETVSPYEAPLIAKLVAASVPITVGVSPKSRALIHTKLILIDGKIAIHGSANWTHAGLVAEQNIIIVDRAAAVVDGLASYWAQVLADTVAHPRLGEVPI